MGDLSTLHDVSRSGLRLSFAQQRMWFLSQMEGVREAYHIFFGWRLRGALDRAALVQALDGIVARHEALRTTFHPVDGEPVQRIAEASDSRFLLVEQELHDDGDTTAALERMLALEARTPFDLERGPLIRGRLIRVGADDHALLIAIHHIVFDAWSIGIFVDELSTLYAAFARGASDPLPPLPLQYADYADWQRTWMEGELFQQEADYWTRTLAGAPTLLELPLDRPRPAQQDYAGARVEIELDRELAADLKALGQRHGTTLYMVLLAGWAALLGRLSPQQDVVVGTPVANRQRAEAETAIGLFVNTLVLRLNPRGRTTVGEFLRQVKSQVLSAVQHQHIPFEKVVELSHPPRNLTHSPLFQVMFSWKNIPRKRLDLPGLQCDVIQQSRHQTSKFDLTLSLADDGDTIGGVLEYATGIFERSTVERYRDYLRTLLGAMVADDTRAIASLPLLRDAERDALLHEDAGHSHALDRGCVHELFEACVRANPEAVAIACGEHSVSYGELNRRANQLAHYLRQRGVGPEATVAVCLHRSVELYIALLGVLKAGASYAPLAPEQPVDRLAYMLADCHSVMVLTQAQLAPIFAGGAQPALCLDGEWEQLERERSDDPTIVTRPDNLAYVMYTSGSTGRPKGVMVTHRAIARLVRDQRYVRLSRAEAVLQFAPASFDASTFEIWGALLNGARLVVMPLVQPTLEEIGATLRNERVTVLWLTSSLFDLMATERPDDLSAVAQLIAGGDVVRADSVRTYLQSSRDGTFVNGYGPTEGTTFSCCHRTRNVDGATGVPIGRAIGETQAYVLDDALQLVPRGVIGELYIAGAGLARGYWNGADLTAASFVPSPYGSRPGERMYRTGDRVRYTADGNIEFIGRIDSQIKIRGYRIDPIEIESCLAEHAGIQDVKVICCEADDGEKRLALYYTAGDATESAPAMTPETVRDYLRRKLPEYMIPGACARLDRLPLTLNGKIDRDALPAPDFGTDSSQRYEEPQDAIEAGIASIWAGILKTPRVGRHDNFFELGGHSLSAVRATTYIKQQLGVDVALPKIFAYPVLADLAAVLRESRRADSSSIPILLRSGTLRLSFAQQRMWFLSQMEGVREAYHIFFGWRLRGALDRAALVQALDGIVARHEALRTTFHPVDGEPVQRIAEASDSRFLLVEQELRGDGDAESALERIIAHEAQALFDLDAGPLIRGRLVRMSEHDHALLFTVHHIVFDGWSTGVFVNELSALYAAFARGASDPLSLLPLQYADYAAWQRTWMEGDVFRQQADYWKQTLAGAPTLLELPLDRPRPPQQDYAGARVEVELDRALVASLKALSQRHGTTLYMVLLAGWAALLGKLSQQQDVVVGTPVANRSRVEIEGLIGFFVNPLALRVDLTGSPTVGGLLARVKQQALAAQQHQDIPFEQVVELLQPARSLAHSPLFQSLFVWQSGARETPALRGLQVTPTLSRPRVTAKCDLMLTLEEADERIRGGIEYPTALFDRVTVERHLEHFRVLLQGMIADDQAIVDRLPILSERERRQVLDRWNETDQDVSGTCVHELFERQAAQGPNAVAVVWEQTSMSYAELNRRANQLAHHLIGLGVGPEARVAICLERGIEMVPAILAVMKAGAAWVPMDPEYPAARLQFMLADSAPVAMLISPHLTATLAPLPAGTTVVEVPRHDPSTPSSNGDGAAANPPRAVVSPRNAAYVIYTSGSTGQPKGVVVEHRGFSNMITAQVRGFGIEPESRVLQFASLGFDASCSEIFIALSCGAALHVNRGIDGLVDLLRRDRVTHATLPPAVLSSLPDQSGFESVAVLITAGESLGREIATRWSAGRRLINAYGPTEATVCATMSAYDAGDPRPPAIGRPIANTRVYILDRDGGPMPAGVLGELHIGGAGVARGYVNQPALTAERFVPDPYAATPGARMYRTGDLGRWRTDGAVEFAGRNDFQIKLRGYRIELDEIAAVLERHDEIRDAVVVVRDDERAGRRLVAYAVRQPQGEGREPDAFDFRRLREHLLASLPEYMVPADVVLLPELPLSPSGKVDRRGLPDPQTADVHMGARQSYVAPRNALEEILCGIWTEVLSWNDVELPERVQAEGVGLTDNFFALGGHSLLAMQVIARIRKSLGMQLPIRALFEQPTVSDIARVLREMGGATAVQAIPRRDRSQPIPLSYAQQRLWFVSQFEAGASAYNVRIAYRITGHLHLMALRLSLEHIVARHEVLRTRFVERKGSVMQAIDPDVTFEVQTEDLRSKADPEEELQRRMRAEVETSFDLARGPMLRAKVLQLGDHEHVLLVTVHHIASDGWSLGLLARELAVCYSAFIRDDKPELPALPFQYADFAAWQRERLDGGGMDAQLKYWETQMQGSSGLLDLHTDYPRPALKGWRGRVIPFTTPKETVDAIRLLCRKQDVTLFMVLLAATQSLLARYTGQTDINIGTPIASRALEDTEKLIGPFANTLVLRLNLQGDPTFTELLKRAREVALGAYAHQDVPFERIVRSLQPKRDLSRTMMFQVTLALQNAGSSIPALEGVQVNRVGRELSICNYDLSFEVYDRQDQIPFSIRYDLALFSEATIRDMGRQLIELLTAAAQEPQRRLSELAAIGII